MEFVRWWRVLLGVAAVPLGMTGLWVLNGAGGRLAWLIDSPGWWVWLALGVGLVCAAAACTTYVGASFAIEHLLEHARDLERRSTHRQEQRRGRTISAQQAQRALVEGVATPRELAEVLDVHEYVARRMLDVLVADGVAERRGDLVVPRPSAETRSLPTGPRWIEP